MDSQTIAGLRAALLEHLVIVIRDQTLEPDQYRAFGQKFGTLLAYNYGGATHVPGHPDILRVIKNKEDRKVFGARWHADVSFLEKPVLGSMLYAIETPPKGGDTLFANMYLAYETLSDEMKRVLESLAGVHESMIADPKAPDSAPWIKTQSVHPVVKIHDETRRKLLNVNRTYTSKFDGMTEEESKPLLKYLFQHQTKAEFTTRVRWSPGTLTFWDNRCTQHLPINDYHGYRREMHRITIES